MFGTDLKPEHVDSPSSSYDKIAYSRKGTDPELYKLKYTVLKARKSELRITC